MTNSGKTISARLICAALAVFAVFALSAVSVSIGASDAAGTNYYICYERDDYRVRAVNKLDARGAEYVISPTLSQGAKFLISDGEGAMYGNAKGEPLTVVEVGTHRYTVRFDPNADGAKVTYEAYTPTEYTISVRDGDEEKQSAVMTYRRGNAVFEEYAHTFYSLDVGDVVTVSDNDGNTYGVSEISTDGAPAVDGYVVPIAGDYRFAFTVDEDHLYDDKNHIDAEDVPTLYVLCEANGFERDDAYRMTRDEDVIAYAEYVFSSITAPEKDCEIEYRVVDATDGEVYKPTSSGKADVHDKGDYTVKYAPEHAYSSDKDADYHVALERVSAYYDGYYVLGDLNDYEFVDSDEFDELYKLVKDESVSDHDEYTLTLYIDSDMLDSFDGAIEFYITDGTRIYRRPLTRQDIRIERAGEYELKFSPTHDYGRGYNYRYERVADEIERDTVYIDTAERLVSYLAECTSPEFSLNKLVVIRNDLDLTGMRVTPAATFAGELDGLFNTVRGIEIDGGDNGAYLFGTVTADGRIKRLGLDVRMNGGDYVAPIRYNYGKIENVTVVGTAEGSSYVSGLVAANYSGGEIVECENGATVNGTLNVGGLAGFNAGAIEDCKNTGAINVKIFGSSDVRGMLNVGGVVGYSTGTLFGCENVGDVGIDQARYFGGIVGLASGGVYFCTNGGNIGAESYVGGVIGYYGRFSDNNSNNPLSQYLQGTDFESWLDEYFGDGDGNFEEAEDSGVREIFYCVNYGNVVSESRAGGIAGAADAGMLETVGCASSGEITAKNSFVGGVVGELGAGTISECAVSGHIVAERGSYAGGIAGSASGRIEYCAASCYVEAEESYVGGIVGSGNTVVNCIAHSYVKCGSGEHFGAVAGAANVFRNNFYPDCGADGVVGIDGVSYGSENGYGACPLDVCDMISTGSLSPELYGLDDGHWLAGELEPRYPVPRCFTELRKPDRYTQTVKLDGAFEAAELMKSLAESVGKTNVTVTFFVWDFDADKYEWLETYFIPVGGGVNAPTVPDEDGYFTWWSVDDFSSFSADTTVNMRYDKYKTALANDDSEHPQIIVTGRFYSDSTLAVEYNGEYVSLKIKRGDVVADYDGTLTVRYRADGNRIAVKLISGGQIVAADTREDGGYVIFELPQGVQFCTNVIRLADNTTLVVGLAIALTALAVSLAFCIPMAIAKIGKRKKKSE